MGRMVSADRSHPCCNGFPYQPQGGHHKPGMPAMAHEGDPAGIHRRPEDFAVSHQADPGKQQAQSQDRNRHFATARHEVTKPTERAAWHGWGRRPRQQPGEQDPGTGAGDDQGKRCQVGCQEGYGSQHPPGIATPWKRIIGAIGLPLRSTMKNRFGKLDVTYHQRHRQDADHAVGPHFDRVEPRHRIDQYPNGSRKQKRGLASLARGKMRGEETTSDR